jgi:hypothetical protein
MIKCLISCLFKPKIKPIEITELDILENKIRLSNEHIIIINNSFKEKSVNLQSVKNKSYHFYLLKHL